MDQRVDLAQAQAFALGPHTVSPSTLEVVAPHGRKVVERRVMQVLVRLAGSGGEVVSRDDLLTHCWAGRTVGDDALYRVIRILRKLSEELGGFAIETVGGVGYRLVRSEAPAPLAAPSGAGEHAIAVLPFANLSADPGQDYFADGLTEEFICQLAQVDGLKVTCRTAAFAYQGGGHDLREIGRALGVSHVLEGSVRRAGDRLRISARLADCALGFELWSQTYDRQLVDVFAVQEEIATAVAAATGAALGIGSAAYGGTRSFEAYDHFLKAGRIWHHLGSHELGPREAHLRQAVAIDPDYGLAWATLACLLSHRRGFLPPAEHARIERDRYHAADRALELAPRLPESQIALACIAADKRDWREADAGCARAVPTPSGQNPQAEAIVGAFLCATGRVRESLRYRINARDFDPLSVGHACALLCAYHCLEMWEAFDTEYERSRDLEGPRNDIEGLRLLRLLVTGAGDNAVADQYGRLRRPSVDPIFGELAAAHGSRARVRAVLDAASDSAPWRHYRVAQLAAAYGEVDVALASLARAAPAPPSGMAQLMWFPEFKATRARPEFKAIVRDTGLARFWRETGKWPDVCRPLGQDDFEFY